MIRMLLALNAVLYLVALGLSLCVVTPVAEGASRRVRVARMILACGGGAAIAGAITLTFLGLWVESAVVGCVALAIVVVCLWIALSQSSSERDDGEDGSDGAAASTGARSRRPRRSRTAAGRAGRSSTGRSSTPSARAGPASAASPPAFDAAGPPRAVP